MFLFVSYNIFMRDFFVTKYFWLPFTQRKWALSNYVLFFFHFSIFGKSNNVLTMERYLSLYFGTFNWHFFPFAGKNLKMKLLHRNFLFFFKRQLLLTNYKQSRNRRAKFDFSGRAAGNSYQPPTSPSSLLAIGKLIYSHL